MPEQIKSASENSSRDSERSRSEWEEELAAAHQEILRLRDLLIGKDAELGQAQGRVAELEAQSQRLLAFAGRAQARLAGVVRLGAGLRGSRGRRR